MTTITQLARSAVLRYWTKPENIAREKSRFQRKQSRKGLPHTVTYFHQVDDPYSFLSAQVLSRLASSYDINLVTKVVYPPNDVDAPERELLQRYARRDCEAIAPYYGLKFPHAEEQPDANVVELAQTLLSSIENSPKFLDYVVPISQALWENNSQALHMISRDLAIDNSPPQKAKAQYVIQRNHKLRGKLGHYLGATFFYGSQWYWGVDRLCYLEGWLTELGLKKEAHSRTSVVTRPEFRHAKSEADRHDITLEYFFSLRSPYTYISMQRVFEMASNLKITLRMRPVLPMMMRGVPATLAKGKYIFTDAKREAEQIFKVPFGNICDTFGFPVTRGYSLFSWAQEQGKAQEFCLNFYRAAFANGIDLSRDAGMKNVVQASGLDWHAAREIIDNDAWRPDIAENQRVLYEELGLWGVPSFRLSRQSQSPLAVWGADRLWLLEDEILKQTRTTYP
jgi:2-hydroxychromene-2-carboxylate isomerase